MNSSRERERNWSLSDSELPSVVGEPLITSETIVEVVACCLSSSLVLGSVFDNALVIVTVVAVVVGMLVVEMSSGIVVMVQELPINGNLCSTA